jgi:hypothetical protein
MKKTNVKQRKDDNIWTVLNEGHVRQMTRESETFIHLRNWSAMLWHQADPYDRWTISFLVFVCVHMYMFMSIQKFQTFLFFCITVCEILRARDESDPDNIYKSVKNLLQVLS